MHQNLSSENHLDDAVSRIAGAIGEPARTRMLHSLLDGRARTGTELAIMGQVSASTASLHLKHLLAQRLVKVSKQGRHCYYSLEGRKVAAALEALGVLAGDAKKFKPVVPDYLRAARTCYDHIAGVLGVALHDRFLALRWLSSSKPEDNACELTPAGAVAFEALGIDIGLLRASRRRFAYGCLDWSERRPHLAGALGAALLSLAIKHKWLSQDAGSRSLQLSAHGRRVMQAQFGLRI
jgi:DNA-binding transcriptional ArsR family regulator